MMDKLLKILKTNPNYRNFTLDGQIIPIEDYLEVRPDADADIRGFIKEGRLSVGPMYILPDEFLISGESIIRNLILGTTIASNLGRVMRTAYIPDPFGHIAQLPQIVSGFDMASVIFERGFGDEFDEKKLNMEFVWKAPGDAASAIGVHLIRGYGSLAQLNVKKENGRFNKAIGKIERVVSDLEHYTATPIVLLNNGSDHFEAYSEIPEIVRQWNEKHPDILMEQNDFEYYINKLLELNPHLKEYQGELRGSKYSHILSGVFSARMWIKQRNSKIEYLYEKYAEPLSSITWTLDKFQDFEYPNSYLHLGLNWLIKNHPHDSICGCSIDEVHREMITRFDWSEQIANQICKLSWLYLLKIVKIDQDNENVVPFFIYNPLPWKRNDIVKINYLFLNKRKQNKPFEAFRIVDGNNNNIEYDLLSIEENPRYTVENQMNYQISFIADVPGCGFKQYQILLGENPLDQERKKNDQDYVIENEFFQIEAKLDGRINIFDKQSSKLYENICSFEDVGDWGDEYDFSGPYRKQVDRKFGTTDGEIIEINKVMKSSFKNTLDIKIKIGLPLSLSEDRLQRSREFADNYINLSISLYQKIRRVDLFIELINNSKDHRIRVLFPSNIITKKAYADGHFYVVPRKIDLPEGKRWMQKPSPTNHQKDFVTVYDESVCFAVANRGLPEYEAIRNEDGTITLAITLLRCVGWLSRQRMDARRNNAGPPLHTPDAQCLGKHKFELSLFIENNKQDWIKAEIHVKAKEFNCPLLPIVPSALKSRLAVIDKLMRTPLGTMDPFSERAENSITPYLPHTLSFLEIDNKNVMLSILKKAEREDFLIIRLYNITSKNQQAQLKFSELITIKNAEIVNLMEEKPKNPINATIKSINQDSIILSINANVIVSIKIAFISNNFRLD
jgi:mannosylglycerate hydrolase